MSRITAFVELARRRLAGPAERDGAAVLLGRCPGLLTRSGRVLGLDRLGLRKPAPLMLAGRLEYADLVT